MLEELINNGIKLTVCKQTLFPGVFFVAIPIKDRKKSKEIIKAYCLTKDLEPKFFINYDNGCLELELEDGLDAEEYGRACKFRKAIRLEVRELVQKRILTVNNVNEFTTLYRPKNSLF